MKRRSGNEQHDAIEGQFDQRPGQWTQLQLNDMDVAFCLRMRHPNDGDGEDEEDAENDEDEDEPAVIREPDE